MSLTEWNACIRNATGRKGRNQERIMSKLEVTRENINKKARTKYKAAYGPIEMHFQLAMKMPNTMSHRIMNLTQNSMKNR